MKEGHIQEEIFEANHIDIKREQQIIPGRGKSAEYGTLLKKIKEASKSGMKCVKGKRSRKLT